MAYSCRFQEAVLSFSAVKRFFLTRCDAEHGIEWKKKCYEDFLKKVYFFFFFEMWLLSLPLYTKCVKIVWCNFRMYSFTFCNSDFSVSVICFLQMKTYNDKNDLRQVPLLMIQILYHIYSQEVYNIALSFDVGYLQIQKVSEIWSDCKITLFIYCFIYISSLVLSLLFILSSFILFYFILFYFILFYFILFYLFIFWCLCHIRWLT